MRAVNLIPADQRAGASVGAGRSQGGAYAVLAVGAGVALLALLYGLASHQVSSRRSQAANLTAQAERAQSEASQLAPYTSFIALREQRQQAVAALVDSRFDWAHAMHELGRVLPANISINSLTGTVGAPGGPGAAAAAAAKPASGAVASSTPPGSVPLMTLGGCASSQKAVATMLNRLHLIDGVGEVTLQSSTKGNSSGSGAGGCPAGFPAYNVTVAFHPLPAAAAAAAAARPVANVSSSTGAAR